MTKFVKLIDRPDGTQVRITMERMYGLGLHESVDTRIHYRKSSDEPWKLASNQPHPNWRQMSVDEYKRSGRPEMFRYITTGELLKASQEFSMRYPKNPDASEPSRSPNSPRPKG